MIKRILIFVSILTFIFILGYLFNGKNDPVMSDTPKIYLNKRILFHIPTPFTTTEEGKVIEFSPSYKWVKIKCSTVEVWFKTKAIRVVEVLDKEEKIGIMGIKR